MAPEASWKPEKYVLFIWFGQASSLPIGTLIKDFIYNLMPELRGVKVSESYAAAAHDE